MRFTKMHGAGNDYLYIDCFSQSKPRGLPALARAMSHRRFGAGADGIILILPSRTADCRMEMYNSDGSRGAMCGNGIRCLAKYVYDRRLVRKLELRIDTDSGVKTVRVRTRNAKVVQATVDMGTPVFERAKIPMRGVGKDGLRERVEIPGAAFEATCLSMGNPHCVIFVPDERSVPIERYGPAVQASPLFPEGVNVECVRVMGRGEVSQRTWERGAGETWACGTGACAAAVATILGGKADRKVRVHLLGGEIAVEWKPGGPVWMTGPAEEVYTGQW